MSVFDTRPVRQWPPARLRGTRVWLWTVGTGAALLVLAAAHIVAQHFVVHEVGGLRTYHQVVEYIATPVIFALECAFLITVTIHALLGVRNVLYDLDLSARARHRIDRLAWTVGVLTVAYGIVLLSVLASRA
jgi:succinate dehydrogenase hydrophobic anchor subunit